MIDNTIKTVNFLFKVTGALLHEGVKRFLIELTRQFS